MKLLLQVCCHSNGCVKYPICILKYAIFFKFSEYTYFYLLKIIICGIIERNSDHGFFFGKKSKNKMAD